MTFSLGDLIVCCIVSGGIGFFWAMWRTDNIKVKVDGVHVEFDVDRFWKNAEKWRARRNASGQESH